MTFDRENLKPLYQMVIGEAGESCAFYIASRLGMPGYMLRRAAREAYGEGSGQELAFSGIYRSGQCGDSEPAERRNQADSGRDRSLTEGGVRQSIEARQTMDGKEASLKTKAWSPPGNRQSVQAQNGWRKCRCPKSKEPAPKPGKSTEPPSTGETAS